MVTVQLRELFLLFLFQIRNLLSLFKCQGLHTDTLQIAFIYVLTTFAYCDISA